MDAVFLFFLIYISERTGTMIETELIERCGKGDNLARQQLYERYAGQLLAVCVRYVGDREAAKDILHDSFLKIFRSINGFTYQGEGSLKAWLVRIAVNEALGYLRTQSAMKESDVILEEIPDLDSASDDSLEDIPPSVLMRFIQELSQGYRTVFNLYVFEEKTHGEIAQLLGITHHASSSQLARARAILKKKINDYIRLGNNEAGR